MNSVRFSVNATPPATNLESCESNVKPYRLLFILKPEKVVFSLVSLMPMTRKLKLSNASVVCRSPRWASRLFFNDKLLKMIMLSVFSQNPMDISN